MELKLEAVEVDFVTDIVKVVDMSDVADDECLLKF